MTTLLTIAILLLISIAVWQITKIFQVAQLNQKWTIAKLRTTRTTIGMEN